MLIIGSSQASNFINGKKIDNVDNEFTRWGKKFEPISKIVYQKFYDCKVQNCATKSHKLHKWIKSRPDGVIEMGDTLKLVEFKNPKVRNITGKIPQNYLVQMQIQLGIYDVQECDYFSTKFYEYENEEEFNNDDSSVLLSNIIAPRINVKGMTLISGKKVFWNLCNYHIETIKRDKSVFDILINKIVSKSNYNSLMNTIAFPKYDLVNVNKLFNFLNDDPLLDWLELYGNQNGYKRDNEFNDYTEILDFNKFINTKCSNFKNKVYENFAEKFTIEFVTRDNQAYLTQNRYRNAYRKFVETKNLIKKNEIDIIINPVLIDEKCNIIVTPSALVSDRVINRLTESNYKTDLKQNGYSILVVKYNELKLCSNGINLRNNGTIKVNKAQILKGNEILSDLLGYTVDTGYVLGRKYSFMKKKIIIKGSNAFERLGVVSRFKDFRIYKKMVEGFKWMKRLKEDGAKWKISGDPNADLIKELFPNMNNKYNYDWNVSKSMIAKELKELTMLWYVGVKHRNNSIARGITSVSDPNCNTNSIGISHWKNAPTIDKIIDINKGGNNNGSNSKITITSPDYITDNTCDWKDTSVLEFYIDLEHINNLHDDLSTFPECTKINVLTFMIGLGYIDLDGKWCFKAFVTDKFDRESEKENNKQMILEVMRICEERGVTDFRMVHYSGNEARYINSLLRKYDKRKKFTATICNLYSIIKNTPFLIKGAYNFKLKDISKAMFKHGYIDIDYENVGRCKNGIQAMTYAFNCKERGIHLNDNECVKDVIKYNEYDVKAMYEIISYLRKNKTKRKRSMESNVKEGTATKKRKLQVVPKSSKKRKRNTVIVIRQSKRRKVTRDVAGLSEWHR